MEEASISEQLESEHHVYNASTDVPVEKARVEAGDIEEKEATRDPAGRIESGRGHGLGGRVSPGDKQSETGGEEVVGTGDENLEEVGAESEEQHGVKQSPPAEQTTEAGDKEDTMKKVGSDAEADGLVETSEMEADHDRHDSLDEIPDFA